MLLWRVLPYLPHAPSGQPGHPQYVHPDQGSGRWDNAGLYQAIYVAHSPSGAVGETFGDRPRWSQAMLPFRQVPGSVRHLVTYRLDEEAAPLLDLDDPTTLVQRALRPSTVVARNRPRTQQIARDVFGEGRWSGLSWWSMHRPQWPVSVLWIPADLLEVVSVEELPGHPALLDAASVLRRPVAADLRR